MERSSLSGSPSERTSSRRCDFGQGVATPLHSAASRWNSSMRKSSVADAGHADQIRVHHHQDVTLPDELRRDAHQPRLCRRGEAGQGSDADALRRCACDGGDAVAAHHDARRWPERAQPLRSLHHREEVRVADELMAGHVAYRSQRSLPAEIGRRCVERPPGLPRLADDQLLVGVGRGSAPPGRARRGASPGRSPAPPAAGSRSCALPKAPGLPRPGSPTGRWSGST